MTLICKSESHSQKVSDSLWYDLLMIWYITCDIIYILQYVSVFRFMLLKTLKLNSDNHYHFASYRQTTYANWQISEKLSHRNQLLLPFAYKVQCHFYIWEGYYETRYYTMLAVPLTHYVMFYKTLLKYYPLIYICIVFLSMFLIQTIEHSGSINIF